MCGHARLIHRRSHSGWGRLVDGDDGAKKSLSLDAYRFVAASGEKDGQPNKSGKGSGQP